MATFRAKPALLASVFILMVCGFIAYAYPLQANNANASPAAQEPTVDYPPSAANAAPLFATDEQLKRYAKSATYDRPGSLPIKETPGEIPLPAIDHWWLHVPALPIDQSNAIAVGTITGNHAFFSNDRHVVYSEFTLQVEQTLKDNTHTLNVGFSVVTTRAGGVVRFPSGRTQKYSFAKQGWPVTGKRYVLFLRKNESGDFNIITGYEFRDGRAEPLDGTPGPQSDHELRKYAGTPEPTLLESIKDAV